MKKNAPWFLIIFFALALGYLVVNQWRGMVFSQEGLSKEDLLQAVGIDPGNPDPFYKLGILYQWNFQKVDLMESSQYLQKAIEKNPLEQEYWLSLAKVLQRMGEMEHSEEALEKAVLTFPTGYKGRWTGGNLLLQAGSLEKAFSHFSYILTYYPNQSGLVYDVCEKTVDDPGVILDRLVPEKPESLNQYLGHLYESGDKEMAQKAWEKRVSLGYGVEGEEALKHIDFLISQREIQDAFQVWKARLREEGRATPSDHDLITDGGFEQEKGLGRGFDWRIGKVLGAEISYDSSVAYEGKKSLKIIFNGKENVDFHQVSQYVPLKARTEYTLKARMKTKDITTRSGLKIEVAGIHSGVYQASEDLVGDNDWKEMIVSFRTAEDSAGGLVRIRRARTDKFDRLISGTVWVDNVQLTEITRQSSY
jgi:tetratricopeptide (TPR) repeat protein